MAYVLGSMSRWNRVYHAVAYRMHTVQAARCVQIPPVTYSSSARARHPPNKKTAATVTPTAVICFPYPCIAVSSSPWWAVFPSSYYAPEGRLVEGALRPRSVVRFVRKGGRTMQKTLLGWLIACTIVGDKSLGFDRSW